jgi:hypothetical protein
MESLGTFFNVLLSHPDVFSDVGDPSEQTKWFEDLSSWDWRLSFFLAWQSFRSSKRAEPPLAKDQRRYFAGHLQMFALDFLLFHEVGHWCEGHDKFAMRIQEQINPFINELSPLRLPAIINQFLELRADSFAVIFMTNEWFQMEFGPTSIFKSAREALRVWTIALAFTFILFGQERKIGVVRSVGLHPHPAMLSPYPHPFIRLYNARHTAINIASLFSNKAASITAQAFDDGLATVIQVCRKLNIPSSIWFIEPETAERTYQALCMNWMPYQSELDECTRLKLTK